MNAVPGEHQVTVNLSRALSDYLTNFVFGKGVTWKVPPENEAIITPALSRIWEIDNDKEKVVWEIGQYGSICGDVFVKVAYEESWKDPVGNFHPGRVRILPLNPATCFPEWHPHDRNRMIRFKLKYRFWSTTLEGTRSVFTYTELITDNAIEEYINDELISSRKNPLGFIPIVHCSNKNVASSPWGEGDLMQIIGLNREYNEKMWQVSDIINYYADPVTVIVGARSSQLQRGAAKIWSIPSQGAGSQQPQVYQLGMEGDFTLVISYLDRVKLHMFELVGVPINALGEEQAISNTSGVALAIKYEPTMLTRTQKLTQYVPLYRYINEIALRTLALKEPEMFVYNPDIAPPLKEMQLDILDLRDPKTFRSTPVFPTPLPIDELIQLNIIQGKQALGLESKKGALEDMGEENPDQKLEEIQMELEDDIKRQAALDLTMLEAGMAIELATGTNPYAAPPPAGGGGVTSAGGPGVTGAAGNIEAGSAPPAPLPGPLIDAGSGTDPVKQAAEIATGTKNATNRRNPKNSNSEKSKGDKK